MSEDTVEVTVSPGLAIPDAEAQSLPQDLVLVVFIHGFKGTDSTFGQFPDRLRHVLAETIPGVVVESIVFPAYETKGELNAAVVRFADWLTNLTVQREVAYGVGGGAGKAKIVLCGHSMGGLLAADALIEFVRTRPDSQAPLWPNIVACIAFDTPYFGLHPHVFKNSATQAAGYIRTARSLVSNLSFGSKTQTVPSPLPRTAPALPGPPASQSADSIWKKWAPAAYAVGGAVIAGAAAGTAYYKREELTQSYTWATDHMKYVGTLWDEATLKRRVDTLFKIESTLGVLFRNFYTRLPANPPVSPHPRPFIVLPKSSSPYASHFLPAPNNIASDEISAHTGMFDAKTNDGYYELGLMTAQLIRDILMSIRTVREAREPRHARVSGSIRKEDTAAKTSTKDVDTDVATQTKEPANPEILPEDRDKEDTDTSQKRHISEADAKEAPHVDDTPALTAEDTKEDSSSV